MSSQSRFRSSSNTAPRNPLGVINNDSILGEYDNLRANSNSVGRQYRPAGPGFGEKTFTKRRVTNAEYPRGNSGSRKASDGGHRWLFGLRSRSVSSPSFGGKGPKDFQPNRQAQGPPTGPQQWVKNGKRSQSRSRGGLEQEKREKNYMQHHHLNYRPEHGKRSFSTGVMPVDDEVVGIHDSRHYYQQYDNIEYSNDNHEETDNKKTGFYNHSNNGSLSLDNLNKAGKQPLAPLQLVVSQTGSTRGKPSVVSTTCNIQTSTDAISTSINAAPSNNSLKSDRIICFDRIPEKVGLNSIISQVCGGPLERVVNVAEESSSNPRIVQLHFFQPSDAQSFYEYTMSGRFMVNGISYKPRWGNTSLAAVYSFPKNVYDEMAHNNARRCICLTYRRQDGPSMNPFAATSQTQDAAQEEQDDAPRHNPDNTTSYAPSNGIGATGGTNWKPKAMISSRNICLDVSLATIQKDFGKFGTVLSVTPMILHHVNISIQYADTRHAIRAKKAFERWTDDEMSKRYEHWTATYGKDQTDRRVPVAL